MYFTRSTSNFDIFYVSFRLEECHFNVKSTFLFKVKGGPFVFSFFK